MQHPACAPHVILCNVPLLCHSIFTDSSLRAREAQSSVRRQIVKPLEQRKRNCGACASASGLATSCWRLEL